MNRKRGTRLVFLLILVSYLDAQEVGEESLDQAAPEASAEEEYGAEVEDPGLALGMELYAYPEVPQVYTSWIVVLLVDHPVPEEVRVQHPPLPETLTLESIRTRPHLVRPSLESGEVQTMVEFWFIPQRAGALTLGPFEVRTPDAHRFTGSSAWYIYGETKREYQPVCSWVKPPTSLRMGAGETLILKLNDWDPRKPWPGTGVFLKELPEGALLEAEPLTAQDQEQGVVLRLGVIPLEGTEFTLKPWCIRYEGLNIEIPEIRIPIIPGTAPPSPSPLVADNPPTVASSWVVPFPYPTPPDCPWFRADYEEALQRIQSLWDQGKIPEALGEMRRNERENLAGPAFALLRREAEQALGLTLTHDESWRPRKLYQLLLGLSLGIFALSLAVAMLRWIRGKRLVTSRIAQGYKGSSLVLILGMALLLCALAGLGKLPQGKTIGQGVLRAAQAYRVPEEGSMVSACFSEGEAVHIRSASDYWVYVESFDGKLGWVPRDKLIWY
ncbi:MAG: hypothetical protein LBD93_05405 [Treponema sp.]|nr:hypothetical protein [Treponema sp.]